MYCFRSKPVKGNESLLFNLMLELSMNTNLKCDCQHKVKFMIKLIETTIVFSKTINLPFEINNEVIREFADAHGLSSTLVFLTPGAKPSVLLIKIFAIKKHERNQCSSVVFSQFNVGLPFGESRETFVNVHLWLWTIMQPRRWRIQLRRRGTFHHIQWLHSGNIILVEIWVADGQGVNCGQRNVPVSFSYWNFTTVALVGINAVCASCSLC